MTDPWANSTPFAAERTGAGKWADVSDADIRLRAPGDYARAVQAVTVKRVIRDPDSVQSWVGLALADLHNGGRPVETSAAVLARPEVLLGACFRTLRRRPRDEPGSRDARALALRHQSRLSMEGLGMSKPKLPDHRRGLPRRRTVRPMGRGNCPSSSGPYARRQGATRTGRRRGEKLFHHGRELDPGSGTIGKRLWHNPGSGQRRRPARRRSRHRGASGAVNDPVCHASVSWTNRGTRGQACCSPSCTLGA